jgi:Zn-dependent M28 family amino/carboxypeptidase
VTAGRVSSPAVPNPSNKLTPALLAIAVIVVATASCALVRATSTATRFDSGRAFDHVRQLVTLGPRPPGTAAAAQARRYIKSQLEAAGLQATEQPFTASTPLGPIQMANVSAVIPGKRTDRILFGGHYDTKLFRRFRFVGANDGGSSTAVLLELARVLKHRRNEFTIEIVFFDGEEALVDWSGTDHTYGSRTYVESARKAGTLKTLRAMILVDMVGERDLTIRRESQSTPWLTDLIWAAAHRLGYQSQFLQDARPVEDDHVPFLRAGVPAVDLIDDEPSYGRGSPEPDSDASWHTSADTIDVIAARSLQIVGDVLLTALPKIEARLRKVEK